MRTYTLTEAEFNQINNADTELRVMVNVLRTGGENLFAELFKRKLDSQMAALHAAKQRPVAEPDPHASLKLLHDAGYPIQWAPNVGGADWADLRVGDVWSADNSYRVKPIEPATGALK